MGDWDDTNAQRFGGQPAREPSDACAEDSVLASVLRAASASHDDDPAAAALEALVTAMGLSRASLAAVRNDRDLRRLETIAAAGEHASFARDMPAVPLEQMADAAIAVTEKRALYVADVHGLGDRTGEAETGVARWRAGMSAQAHALLPVIALDRVVGLLTVEWSTPQTFTAEERESLEGVALLFGLILSASGQAAPSPTEEPTSGAAAGSPADFPVPAAARTTELGTGVSLFGYGVTGRGLVVPDAPEGPLAQDLVLRVMVAAGEATETSCPFWDVVGAGPHALVVVGGSVQAPRGDAETLAATCAAMLRTSCSHGRPPAEALHTLGNWLITAGPGGAWISAGCWRVDLAKGTAVSSVAGAVASARRSGDDRSAVSVAEQPALGSTAGPVATDTYDFLLPGDSLVVCVGSVAWARAEAGRQALARALSHDGGAAGSDEAARRLAELSADSSIAPLVAYIEVLGG